MSTLSQSLPLKPSLGRQLGTWMRGKRASMVSWEYCCSTMYMYLLFRDPLSDQERRSQPSSTWSSYRWHRNQYSIGNSTVFINIIYILYSFISYETVGLNDQKTDQHPTLSAVFWREWCLTNKLIYSITSSTSWKNTLRLWSWKSKKELKSCQQRRRKPMFY